MFVTLTCAFRYGREDLDVLGLSFRKDLFIATYQAFPPMPNPPRPPTRLQDRLLRKLGQHAHPFFFTVRMPSTLCGARGLGLCLGGGGAEVVVKHLLWADLIKKSKEGPPDPPPFRVTLHSWLPLPFCLLPGAPSFFLSHTQDFFSSLLNLRLGGRFGDFRQN